MKQVFVIGRHRSGTTWLANILASHPKVFTPSHEAHRGQHESEFFSSVVPYCRIGETQTDRIAIRAILERSDFWHLLFPEEGPSIDIEKLGIHGYFSAALDEAARLRDCTHWVEKTPAHTLLLGELLDAFPDATFVGVERDRLDMARSNVHRFANPKKLKDWVRVAVWNEIYVKIFRLYCDRVHVVRYENLLRDFDGELEALLRVTGLDDVGNLQSNWAPNTSFENGKQPPEVASLHQIVISVVALVFRVIPGRFCEAFARNRVKKLDKPLPHHFFRVFAGKNGRVSS